MNIKKEKINRQQNYPSKVGNLMIIKNMNATETYLFCGYLYEAKQQAKLVNDNRWRTVKSI